ncbi:hypothetical protein HYPSUDRAFT_43211 [Hypholoma sublateritium FD-334 SS-4]|uniref:Paired domain-containing protein n=1 Tax=Hypholoma sublateritium (strain FD-334 SS-4) TaxID=945553 RepID=A0A0D2NUU5_HYPSF|nr:hypothetical protein HYPSUDRAFT_43211 [Hypholoma sublateritium FD-334 SS-4]
MPPRLSDDLKELIIQWYYVELKTMEEIRDLAHCSIGLVYNVICNYRDFGQVRKPTTSRAGRPCTLTDTYGIYTKKTCHANLSTESQMVLLDKIRFYAQDYPCSS